MLAIFGIGQTELIILGILCLLALGGVIPAVVIVVLLLRSGGAAYQCPSCHARNSREAKFCQRCGVQLQISNGPEKA